MGWRIKDPPRAHRVKYEDVRDQIRTGDVFLTVGKGLGSWFIKFGSGSAFTHTMQAYRASGAVLVMHSHANATGRDVFAKGWVEGFQTNLLYAFLEEYDGRVYWRRLVQDGDETRPRDLSFEEVAEQWRQDQSGKRYERNWFQLIGAAFRSIRNKEDASSLFCSEATADLGHRLGWLSPSKPANEYTPEDFSHYQADRKPQLMPGWYLRPEVEIVL